MSKYILPIIIIFISIIGISLFYHISFVLTFFIIVIGGCIGTILGVLKKAKSNYKKLELKYLGIIFALSIISILISFLLLAYFREQSTLWIILLNTSLILLSIYMIERRSKE